MPKAQYYYYAKRRVERELTTSCLAMSLLRMEIDILQALNTEPTVSTRRINGFKAADVLHKRFAYCTIGVVDIQHTIFLPSYST